MPIKCSVILCTHNPRKDFLGRVWETLQRQTLPRSEWELVVIDNASSSPLQEWVDLSWHASGRVVAESKLGLTAARLRGIAETKAPLLVFVDDDNLLNENYLTEAVHIAFQFPQLGAFGAGKIVPEFEVAPSPEIMPFTQMLALRNEEKAHWANTRQFSDAIPYGAGICVRQNVALAYSRMVTTDRVRLGLGRNGKALLSGEDVDLALVACEEGLGTGVFPELSLLHLIPASRLKLEYLERIAEGHAISHALLARLWKYEAPWSENSIMTLIRHLKTLRSLKGAARRIYLAEHRGRARARVLLASLQP